MPAQVACHDSGSVAAAASEAGACRDEPSAPTRLCRANLGLGHALHEPTVDTAAGSRLQLGWLQQAGRGLPASAP
eukprot:COSAG06_NODE_60835_length_269_cov_1.211765_1_plen_74_part_10